MLAIEEDRFEAVQKGGCRLYPADAGEANEHKSYLDQY
jgi:hypothetical protein